MFDCCVSLRYFREIIVQPRSAFKAILYGRHFCKVFEPVRCRRDAMEKPFSPLFARGQGSLEGRRCELCDPLGRSGCFFARPAGQPVPANCLQGPERAAHASTSPRLTPHLARAAATQIKPPVLVSLVSSNAATSETADASFESQRGASGQRSVLCFAVTWHKG